MNGVTGRPLAGLQGECPGEGVLTTCHLNGEISRNSLRVACGQRTRMRPHSPGMLSAWVCQLLTQFTGGLHNAAFTLRPGREVGLLIRLPNPLKALGPLRRLARTLGPTCKQHMGGARPNAVDCQ